MFNPTELPLPVVKVECQSLVGEDDGGGVSRDGTPVEEHMFDVDRVGEDEGGGLGPGSVVNDQLNCSLRGFNLILIFNAK